MIEVQEVEEIANPIAEVQQWVLKDALRKHFSYAQFQKEAMHLLLVRTAFLFLRLNTNN